MAALLEGRDADGVGHRANVRVNIGRSSAVVASASIVGDFNLRR